MHHCIQLAGDQAEQGPWHIVRGTSQGLHEGGHGRRHHPIQHEKLVQGPLGEFVERLLLLTHVLRCSLTIQGVALSEGRLPLE